MREILTPEGLFVYDRLTGLCAFTPEVKSRSWDKPLYAQIALTDRCNFSCWFCYSRSSPDRGLEWEADDLKRLIDFLDSWGLFGVSFGGGEPFLYAHLAEVAGYAWRKTGLDVTVTTNGSAASEAEIAELEGCVSEVRVSVRNAESLTYLKKFTGRKFDVGVNLLLFRSGAEQLQTLIQKALKLGVSDFLINSFLAVGRGRTYANMEPVAQDYAALAEIIRRYSRRATFKVSSRVAETLKDHVKIFMPFESEARGRIIAITADRKVKPSSLSEESYSFRNPEEIPKIYLNMTRKGIK